MSLYKHTALVEWMGGPFPLDMLRYDRCWPVNDGGIRETNDYDRGVKHSVRVSKVSTHHDPVQAWTGERWASFGVLIMYADVQVWEDGEWQTAR